MSDRAAKAILEYSGPATAKGGWHQQRFWAAIALPLAIVYAILTFGLTATSAFTLPAVDWPDAHIVVLFVLMLTSPLFLIALIVAVLGHNSPGGRRSAGPAMWVIAVVPGSAALLHLAVGLFRGYATFTVVAVCAGIALVDTAIILVLRGRILVAKPDELGYGNPVE